MAIYNKNKEWCSSKGWKDIKDMDDNHLKNTIKYLKFYERTFGDDMQPPNNGYSLKEYQKMMREELENRK